MICIDLNRYNGVLTDQLVTITLYSLSKRPVHFIVMEMLKDCCDTNTDTLMHVDAVKDTQSHTLLTPQCGHILTSNVSIC